MVNLRLQVMDVSCLKAVSKELSKKILPSRFEKAQQPEQNTLQIGLRTLQGLTWIEICWNGQNGRLVTIDPPLKTGSKSTLAQQLQHGLKNLALIQITQKGFERIIEFGFAKRPNEPIQKTLTLELMGRHSNIFLLDKEGKVITLGKQIRNHQSRLRPISTGDIYIPPPALKGIVPSKEESFIRWKQRLTLLPITLKESLQDTYQGISPSLALQLVSDNKKIGQDILSLNTKNISIEVWSYIYKRWVTWIEQIEQETPYLYFKGPTDFMNWDPSSSKDSEKDICLKLGQYYANNIILRKIDESSKRLHNNLTKLELEERNELSNQKLLLKKAANEKSTQIKADEILCLRSPTKEQIATAQKLYKKAKKLKRSVLSIKKRIVIHEQKIINIEESLNFLTNLLTNEFENHNEKLNRLIELENELQEFLIKPKKNKVNPNIKKVKTSNHLEIYTDRGLVIQIGRNHRQNEFISIKKAKKGDLWFHAQECPGSHVVLKASVNIYNDSDIELAADFASLFSKAKGNKNSPVVMAPIENLQRIPGALPGTVSLRSSKVVWGQAERALKHLTAERSRNDLLSSKSP